MFRSAVIIPAVSPLGKCAILFLPVQTQNSGSDLPQGHLGNIADGCSQDGEGFRSIEVTNMLKVTLNKVNFCVIAAPGQEHKADTVFQKVSETGFHSCVIQCFQETARFDKAQILKIILFMILNNGSGRAEKIAGKVRHRLQGPIAVFQRLNDSALILRLHPPDGYGASGTAVGIGHIKDVPQTIAPVSIHQQGNPSGASVHPPAMLVPEIGLSAGCGIRLLSEDQKLVAKTVLEVMGGGCQKRHIVFAAGGNLFCGSKRKLDNRFCFSCQRLSLLFPI